MHGIDFPAFKKSSDVYTERRQTEQNVSEVNLGNVLLTTHAMSL